MCRESSSGSPGVQSNNTNLNEEATENKNNNDDDETPPPSPSSPLPWPEDQVGLWGRWTYTYMGKILWDRFQRNSGQLSHHDLYSVPDAQRSRVLLQQFTKEYQSHLAQPRVDAETALKRTLWTLARPSFLPAGICQLVSILSQVGLPLLVRSLLEQVQVQPDSKVDLWPAFGILALLLIYGLANHRQRHLALKAGATLRAALLTVLYAHVLQKAPHLHSDVTTGQVTNLVAVDTHKIYEVVQEGHLIWALPLAIVLVTICLLVIMGPVSLVGMAVLVALVPVVQGITNTLGRLRTSRAKSTDARIECTTALLQGMRVAKLNHYEPQYQRRILAIRDEEYRWLVKEAAVWATTMSVSKLSAAFAAAATFATYVLVDDSHILTAPQSFATFLLLAALRFPINYAGRFLGRYAQAKSSLTRIAGFLSSQSTWADDMTSTNHPIAPGEHPLVVKQASFVVGNITTPRSAVTSSHDGGDSIADESEQTSFVVSTFDFTVHKGEVLACCGPVGSGKSTLLQGILGHLPAASETSIVEKRGSIAWVPQSPFILNATLRDNILFGRPFIRQVYYAVVEACCLGPDLESLGSTGDLTEIGERGVTLSG